MNRVTAEQLHEAIQRFRIVLNTLSNILPSLSTYGGIFFILYYFFAVIGMAACTVGEIFPVVSKACEVARGYIHRRLGAQGLNPAGPLFTKVCCCIGCKRDAFFA